MSMSKSDLMKYVAATLTTLLECDEKFEPFPRSSLYMLVGMDIHKSELVETVLVKTEMVKVTSQTLTLLPHGKEIAKQLLAALPKVQHEQLRSQPQTPTPVAPTVPSGTVGADQPQGPVDQPLGVGAPHA